MKVGDLIRTVYDKRWAIVTEVFDSSYVIETGADFVYPDGTKGRQPRSKIKEVINAEK